MPIQTSTWSSQKGCRKREREASKTLHTNNKYITINIINPNFIKLCQTITKLLRIQIKQIQVDLILQEKLNQSYLKKMQHLQVLQILMQVELKELLSLNNKLAKNIFQIRFDLSGEFGINNLLNYKFKINSLD